MLEVDKKTFEEEVLQAKEEYENILKSINKKVKSA